MFFSPPTPSSLIRFDRQGQRSFVTAFSWLDRSLPTYQPLDPALILHPGERSHYDAFTTETRRFSYLAGRFCAKRALARLCPLPDLTKVQIDSGIFNQPIVRMNRDENWKVAIAHDESAALAIAFPEAHPVSVDMESLETVRQDWIGDALTHREQQYLATEPPELLSVLGYLIWTAKESLAKVLQTGLMLDLEVLETQHIEKTGDSYRITFRHFFQYHVMAFVLDKRVVSLLLPARSVPVFLQ